MPSKNRILLVTIFALFVSNTTLAQSTKDDDLQLEDDAEVSVPLESAPIESPPPIQKAKPLPQKFVAKKREKKYQTFYNLTPPLSRFDVHTSYISNTFSVTEGAESISTKNTNIKISGLYGITANQGLGVEYTTYESTTSYRSFSATAKGSPSLSLVYKGNINLETDLLYFQIGYLTSLEKTKVNLNRSSVWYYRPPNTILAEIGWIHPTINNYYGVIFSNPISSSGSYERTEDSQTGTVNVSATTSPKLLAFFEYRDDTHFNMSLSYSVVTPGEETSSMDDFNPKAEVKTENIELATSFRIPIYSSNRYFFLPELHYTKMKYLNYEDKLHNATLSNWGFNLTFRILL